MARCQKVSRYYIIFFYKTFITVIYICRLSYTWVFFNTVSSKIPQKDFYKGYTYIFFFQKNVLDQKFFFDQNFYFIRVKNSSQFDSTLTRLWLDLCRVDRVIIDSSQLEFFEFDSSFKNFWLDPTLPESSRLESRPDSSLIYIYIRI